MGRAAVIIRGSASKLEVYYSLADAWEQAARKKYGLVSMVPQTAFQLVLRKQTSLLPQARTKKEQHLEFCQALADMREGRFTTQNKDEIFELAALAVLLCVLSCKRMRACWIHGCMDARTHDRHAWMHACLRLR